MRSARWPIGRDRLLFGLPIVLYLLARLPSLLSLPLFIDEAVYLLRAQHFPAAVGASIGGGKLLQELVLALLAQLPYEPLLSSRLFSVVCGLGTVLILPLIGRALDQRAAGILAAVLYAGAPLAVLHDRLGLSDSLLTCASASLLLASISFARSTQVGRSQAVAIGIVIDLAMLAKFSGVFLCYVPVLVVLALTDSWAEARRRLLPLRSAAIVVLACLAALLLAKYGIDEASKAGVGSLGARLAQMSQYTWTLAGWLIAYLPAPLLIPPLLALALRRHIRADSWRILGLMLACGLALHAIFVLLGNTLYPRYVMPAWPALLIACAVGAIELWRIGGGLRWLARTLCVAAIGAALAWDVLFVVRLQRNPTDTPMVPLDRWQYLEAWTSGYTIPEILDTLRRMAVEQNGILLVNHYQPRLIHLAPEIYLSNDPLVVQQSLNLQLREAPAMLRQMAVLRPAYLLLDEEEQQAFDLEGRVPNIRLLRVFENPLRTMRFYLYELPPLPIASSSVIQ
ncbi:MAG TPA: glycosyltransferase family 39 protein [Roseiflexaceae bacterium]|nr:glycosyltransferase family 39 protein [Roseiflexaceae bacterium]